jgi:hypothetical protein
VVADGKADAAGAVGVPGTRLSDFAHSHLRWLADAGLAGEVGAADVAGAARLTLATANGHHQQVDRRGAGEVDRARAREVECGRRAGQVGDESAVELERAAAAATRHQQQRKQGVQSHARTISELA